MRSRTALLVVASLLAAGCSSSAPAPRAAAPSPTATSAAAAATGSTVWICRPGTTPNPCTTDLDVTVATKTGRSKAAVRTPASPPADCFYVYPTVSSAPADNAPRASAPDVVDAVHAQAALFSSVCRVFVPAYRQVTSRALVSGRYFNAKNQDLAYGDVRDAWHDYLRSDNGNRPVVLIGHSQGAMMLTRLIAAEIDRAPAVRARLLSAILLGGNVSVATGKDVGGSFTSIPACRRAGQTGCVVAYSSFANPPSSFALFGRSSAPGTSVLCTDPTTLAGGSGLAHPYIPARLVPGGPRALPGTGFVAYPGQLRVGCKTATGATWLQVSAVPGSVLPAFQEQLGPAWGLHIADVNLALGDLIEAVRREEQAHPKG
jgi:hypothetical protein